MHKYEFRLSLPPLFFLREGEKTAPLYLDSHIYAPNSPPPLPSSLPLCPVVQTCLRRDLDRSRLHVFLTYPNPRHRLGGSQSFRAPPVCFLHCSPRTIIHGHFRELRMRLGNPEANLLTQRSGEKNGRRRWDSFFGTSGIVFLEFWRLWLEWSRFRS